ncbi:MAG TPA: hypothetical protein P5525_22370, partial [Candidatus Paceibacterota bacterium]|nr:hypothetical protein [Candidatus Paceibacterota bacterium]
MTRPDITPRRRVWRGVLLSSLLLAVCEGGLVLLALLGQHDPLSEGRDPRVPGSRQPQLSIGASPPAAAS